MRIGERETGRAVIKLAIRPRGDGMATGASGSGRREVRSNVVRNAATQSCGLVPVGGMAAEAVRGLDPVIVIDVAICAGRGCVRADQCETGHAVIEGGAVPSFGSVAVCAIGRGEIRARRGGTGVVVCCHLVRWQPEFPQSVGAVFKL